MITRDTNINQAYIIFAGQVKDLAPLGIVSEDIKPLLKPVQTAVKDVSRMITDSIWGHLAVPPGSQPQPAPVPAPQSTQPTYPHSLAQMLQPTGPRAPPTTHIAQQQQQPPALSLQTRGMAAYGGGLALEPLSAVSTHSLSGGGGGGVSGSGYVTPLPATPLSAALGPAALATVPVLLGQTQGQGQGQAQGVGASGMSGGVGVGASVGGSAGGMQPVPGGLGYFANGSAMERSRSASQRR